MKQVIITIIMLAVALALVIRVVVPLMKHGAGMGSSAVSGGQDVLPRLENILK